MAEKRSQEETGDGVAYKRPCVENKNPSDVESADNEAGSLPVLPGPASWESQGSSSDTSASGSGSASSSSGPRLEAVDSSSEGSASDSLDLGLGDVQPQNLPGPMGWLQKQMLSGVDPRTILVRIIPSSMSIPEEMDEFEMWSIIAEYLRSIDEPPPRQKLEQYNTFDDAIRLLQNCRNILVLTGAGVSVSCGIPDFRSRDGVYARLAVDFPDLPDPQAMFEISYFRRDPRPFFKFAKELFPGQFKPSTSHKFISQLEQHGKLLRNYTQNIDTLEQSAGITRVIQCHGSFATATCTRCTFKVDSDFIRDDIFNQIVPVCPHCGPDTPEMAVLKPDIVFFGEGLPSHFYNKLDDDKESADLLIVMGSSLKVRPVATIPSMLPKNVPQILINREPLPHLNFDIELLGDCDVIINEILHRLGESWNHACQSEGRLQEVTEKPDIPRHLFPSHAQDVKPELSRNSESSKQTSSGADEESKDSSGAEKALLPGTEKHFPEEMFPVTPPTEDVPSGSAQDESMEQELGASSEPVDVTSPAVVQQEGENALQSRGEVVVRTSDIGELQTGLESAKVVQTNSASCLIRESSDSSTSQTDRRTSKESLKGSEATNESVGSPDSPPFPHPDAHIPPQSDKSASPEKPHRQHHHHHHHHENAASEYMHFQKMLDSSSHGLPHTSCEAMDSRYFADGKRKQHHEHSKSDHHLHHHEHNKSEHRPHRERTKSESEKHAEHTKSEHQTHRARSKSECEQNVEHASSEPSLECTNSEQTPEQTKSEQHIKMEDRTLLCIGDARIEGSKPEAVESEHGALKSEGAMQTDQSGSGNDESLPDHKPDVQVNQDDESSSSPETTPEARSRPSTSRQRSDSISTHLKESTYLFVPPSRYIFHGAEVYLSSDSESEADNNSHNDLDDIEHSDLVHDLDNGDLADDIENGALASDIDSDLVRDLENGHSGQRSVQTHVSAKSDPLMNSALGISPSHSAKDQADSGHTSQQTKTSLAGAVTNGINRSPFEAPPAVSEDRLDIQ